jgi:hypothetical protein
MASIQCGHCKTKHATISQVRTCAFNSYADKKALAEVAPALPKVDFAAIIEKLEAPLTEPGMYRKPNGTIYRVKFNKAGTGLYAERVTIVLKQGKSFATFVYMKGAVNELNAGMRLTADEMIAFNVDVVNCCVCGRVLTAKKSKEQKIGPICIGKI